MPLTVAAKSAACARAAVPDSAAVVIRTTSTSCLAGRTISHSLHARTDGMVPFNIGETWAAFRGMWITFVPNSERIVRMMSASAARRVTGQADAECPLARFVRTGSSRRSG